MEECKKLSIGTLQRRNFPEKYFIVENHAKITKNAACNTQNNSSKTPQAIRLPKIILAGEKQILL